jgi:hypothetical protein
MYLDFTNELRRIRITLVVMTIILLFTGGSNHNVTVDHNANESVSSQYQKNLVPLGNGYFGLLTSESQWAEGNKMKVYFYDAKENKMVLKSEEDLETVEMQP